MAPRTAKAKKPVEKVTDSEAPKRGRGKGKNVSEPEVDAADLELSEKIAPVTDKKPKRGKKAANDSGEPQEDVGPPAKKGRKKNVDEVPATNGDQSGEEDSSVQAEENEQSDDNLETNGHTEEAPSSGKGRKKPAKKEPAPKKETKGRGRKAKPEVTENDDTPKDEVEEKPKPAPKGRGRKPAKVEAEPEDDKSEEEEIKEKPAPKGRKKAAAKVPEKVEDDDEADEEEEKPEPKKGGRGRKPQGKKAPPKEDADDDADEEDTSSKKRKVTKKADKNDEDEDAKPAKGKRGPKKAVEASTETDDEQENEPTTKRRRKGADEKAPAEDTKKKAPPKNKSVTDFTSIDFANSSNNSQGKDWNFKIASWNVDGIRAWSSKGCLDYLKYEKPDILCVQEVKCSQDKLPSEIANPPGYHAYWLAGEKDGYAGVGIYTTKLAISVVYGLQNEELDTEGRIITAEYEQFYLICTYVPNSGRKLVTLPKRLQWNEEFRRHVKELDKKKPVIICGDMNVSHKEIDLANPKTNRKNAGFTDEERAGMTDLLGDGFVDTFRHLYPDKVGAYTFWTYMSNSRARNVGWRLDYFIMSERLLPALCDNVIREKVYGSDHCPLTLFLHLRSADKPKE
ncbi:DNA-(apurinic or apyrimidinic site) lyase [Trichoplusia ni]|uniref:DNA-(apurinic or apyrimidinic site) endonuclease n=1 Tax=Trichoplusia ni TaxID=7111 RepID=A0A7E5X477_TRINI|nr:DNA-(apurinic or apyrimidinic site) lyase [Trichoplusia ni]